MKIKNIINYVLFGLIIISLLAGSSTAQEEHSSTLKKIIDKGEIVIGLAETFPAVYKDIDTGKWTGPVPEIWRMLGKEMGVEVKFLETTWSTFPTSLRNREFDFMGSATFYRVMRATMVSFTNTLYYLGEAVVARSDDERFNTMEDVYKEIEKGKVVIGAGLAQAGALAAKDKFPNAELKEFEVTSNVQVGESLRARVTDLWVVDESVARPFVEKNDWAKLIGVFDRTPVGFCVRYEDVDLREFLNYYVNYVRISGIAEEEFRKFGMPSEYIW